MPVRAKHPAFLFLILLLIAALFRPTELFSQLLTPSLAQSDSFEAAFTYPGETIDPERDAVSLEITLRNTGLRGDTFFIEVTEAPEGWTYELSRYSTVLTGIFVPEEENVSLTLTAFPPKDEQNQDGSSSSSPSFSHSGVSGLPHAHDMLPEGQFDFKIKVTSQRTGNSAESTTTLTIASRKTDVESLSISTSYPEIGGPSDGRFAFTLDIKNQGPDEARVNLAAEVPQGWEHSFKPGYEDKQISSIQVPRGQTRSVTLDLIPSYQAEAGTYPVRVMAETSLASAEASLRVNLSGTYKIRTGALNDLLSTSTEAGKPVTISLFVLNEGSATQKEVSFLAVKPDNWDVTFTPPSLQNLPPRGRPVQVDMTVTPAQSALVGDYGVGLSVEGEKSQSSLDFRITVKAGSAWAWIGALIIILVVVGLALTFKRLGRR